MSGFYEATRQARDSKATRAEMDRVRDRIDVTFQAFARAAGMTGVTVRRLDGVRPKGRPYARLLVEGAREWGNANEPPRRLLARAAAATARTGRRGRR